MVTETDGRRKILPPESLKERAYIKSLDIYRKLYDRSLKDPSGFWGEMAETEIDWFKRWDTVYSWDPDAVANTWFEGGELNASFNCLDRHCEMGKKKKVALIWEPDTPGEAKIFTYQQLLEQVCMFSNVLKKHGVGRGDRVCIYLPMVPELPIAMLACARIGAIHSVVFGGFSSEALKWRILDSGAHMLICADGGFRGGKVVPLKANADRALEETPDVSTVIVVRRTGEEVPMRQARDTWWHREMEAGDISGGCKPEVMGAEDPLFILYTSGSTGKPKGVIHTTGGYLLYAALTHKWIFDVKDDDVWWCSADIGWVTGHSYIVYGPLANGSTSVMFEGVPTYPKPDRYWKVCEKHQVTGFYTAPTVIRALMRLGDMWTRTADLSSLEVLGSVGEPINPEVWLWYYDRIGGGRCPVLDTWWQTETGGIMIAPLAAATPMKPGSASFPFFGVDPTVLREDGSAAAPGESGYLVIKKPWPAMLRSVWGRPEAYREIYFSTFPGRYLTGDGCKVDKEGYFWLQGRIDDVINVSGHRIGTAEIESAIVSDEAAAEAAVVGVPHKVKGQGIYAFVTLAQEREGEDPETVAENLSKRVKMEIGSFAAPDIIQLTPDLPKTRSGKIMRRILRKVAEGKYEEMGDTSTIADPSVLDEIIPCAKDKLADLDHGADIPFVVDGYHCLAPEEVEPSPT